MEGEGELIYKAVIVFIVLCQVDMREDGHVITSIVDTFWDRDAVRDGEVGTVVSVGAGGSGTSCG